MSNKNPKTEQLTPFKPGQSGNPNGRPRNPISSILKELGENQLVEFEITVTDSLGKKKVQKGKIDAGKNNTINHVLAVRLINKAMNGDLRAIRELLDRTEGKSRISIEHSGEIKKSSIPVINIDGRPHATERATEGDDSKQ